MCAGSNFHCICVFQLTDATHEGWLCQATEELAVGFKLVQRLLLYNTSADKVEAALLVGSQLARPGPHPHARFQGRFR